jgi:hypothetical protein
MEKIKVLRLILVAIWYKTFQSLKEPGNVLVKQKLMIMKNNIIKILSLFVISLLVFASCNSNTEKKVGGIKIGNIVKDNQSAAKLTISLNDAASLMLKHNRLTEEWLSYTYTRAWVEVIQLEEKKFNYYLGVEASLVSNSNKKAHSCYSVYSELTVNNSKLYFHPNSFQQSCTGSCCNGCKLVLFENSKIGCSCETPSAKPDCKDEGRCDSSISRIMDEEQKKNDII